MSYPTENSHVGTATFPQSIPSRANRHHITYENVVSRSKKVQNATQRRWRRAQSDTAFLEGSYDGSDRSKVLGNVSAQTKFVANIISPKVAWLSGWQVANRKQPVLKPLKQSSTKAAEQLNTIFKAINNGNGILQEFSTAVATAITSGICLVEPYIDVNAAMPCTIKLKRWASHNFIIDENFKQLDLSDCGFVLTQQLMDIEEARATFRHMDDAVFERNNWSSSPFRTLNQTDFNIKGAAEYCNVERYWYKTTAERFFAIDMNSGRVQRLDNKEHAKQIFEELKQMPAAGVDIIQRRVVTWGLNVFVNGSLAAAFEDNPYGMDICPLTPITYKFVPEGFLRYGSLVGELCEYAYLASCKMTQLLDGSQGRPSAGMIYPNGSIDNIDALTSGTNVAYISYDAQLGKPEFIDPPTVAPTDLAWIEQIRNMASESCPVTASLQGMQVDSRAGEAGVKTMLDQSAGLVGLAQFSSGLDFALCQLGKKLQSIVCNRMPTWVMKSILEVEELDPNIKHLMDTDFMVTVAQAQPAETENQAKFQQWQEFCQLTGIQLPPSAWASIATMEGADEILQMVQQQADQAAKVQQEANQLSLALQEAQLAELKAKAISDLAMAEERLGRTRSNVGLLNERLSEMDKNAANVVATLVDAETKLIQAKSAANQNILNSSEQQIKQMFGGIELKQELLNGILALLLLLLTNKLPTKLLPLK